MNRYLLAMTACLLATSNVMAADGGEILIKKSNCTTCHAIDKKMLGPAFKDVAAKYKDDKGAQAILEKKVRNGGSGVWGKLPMPATANSIDDNTIKIIVQWVLSLK